MENKDPGRNLALWLPGGAVVVSLLVTTFALTRAPFLESRPAGAQFQVQLPIDARLWQDPFDAIERYRKKFKETGEDKKTRLCPSAGEALASEKLLVADADVMVAAVAGGPYADEVEQRRRTRYAVLAGLKNAQLEPSDEQHVGCLTLPRVLNAQGQPGEIPYEMFTPNAMESRAAGAEPTRPVILLWLKEDYLMRTPLTVLNGIRMDMPTFAEDAPLPPGQTASKPRERVLKVIGPASSTVLREMYRDELHGDASDMIEIYSPQATAEKDMLMRGMDAPVPATSTATSPAPMKLLRTVSDDRALTRLLISELKRRSVDPVMGVSCAPGIPLLSGSPCGGRSRPAHAGRVALISEWDGLYPRALAESFKAEVAQRAGDSPQAKEAVDKWVRRFSYLRGIDGRLPEEAASAESNKPAKDSNQIDLSPLEKADGNSQLDYLRRLADHIAREDDAYREAGEPGIGAIGVLGSDTYDKLLALQALKSRLPGKVFFSTDLDARILQRGQAETARNLVLAAPYGLTLTRALQQDLPPFRDSLQSAVFVAVLAARAPGAFEAKRIKFEDGVASLLTPGIYEVGLSGFIPLQSHVVAGSAGVCEAPSATRPRTAEEVSPRTTQDILKLSHLQDPPPPPYPELSEASRKTLDAISDFLFAGPLAIVLLGLAIFLGWWWTAARPVESSLPRWVTRLPLVLNVIAAASAWIATREWRVEFMWVSFVMIVLGAIAAQLVRGSRSRAAHAHGAGTSAVAGLLNSAVSYVVPPGVVFVLAILLVYQMRRCLTQDGAGEPMFLFEGISAWPSLALRFLAILISISALAWGWRRLSINGAEIQSAYHLPPCRPGLLQQFPRFPQGDIRLTFKPWLAALGQYLFRILIPLSATSVAWMSVASPPRQGADDRRGSDAICISAERFWDEHCLCGAFGARMVRAVLATWVFVVITSVLYVIWPIEGLPIRGDLPSKLWSTVIVWSFLLFQLLVFWVVDANNLLVRFIRQLIPHEAVWPDSLQKEHERIFGAVHHPCIDGWVDMMLIAKRSSAVNRLIYAPTVVLLILIVSRSSVFDNWQTPPSMSISFGLTVMIAGIGAFTAESGREGTQRDSSTDRCLPFGDTRHHAQLRQVSHYPRAHCRT